MIWLVLSSLWGVDCWAHGLNNNELQIASKILLLADKENLGMAQVKFQEDQMGSIINASLLWFCAKHEDALPSFCKTRCLTFNSRLKFKWHFCCSNSVEGNSLKKNVIVQEAFNVKSWLLWRQQLSSKIISLAACGLFCSESNGWVILPKNLRKNIVTVIMRGRDLLIWPYCWFLELIVSVLSKTLVLCIRTEIANRMAE